MSKKEIIKEIITDPGIGFNTASLLFFSSFTTAVGFYACVLSLVVSVTLKIISLNIKSNKNLIIFDQRLSLWLMSFVLTIISIDSLLITNFISALASSFFAISNIRVAESITKKGKDKETSIFYLILKRPDLYIFLGSIFSCLMAGKQSMILIPLLFASLFIALKNAWNLKPEHNMHPKIIMAFISFSSLLIGLYNHNILVGIAHGITGITYINIESHITPGGFKQVIKNLKTLIKYPK